MLDSDASTAKTLVLVAIILQAIGFAIGILFVIVFAAGMLLTPVTTTGGPGGVTATITTVPNAAVIVGLVFGVIFLIGLIWLLLDYFLIYKRLAEERVQEAETPALVLGIIQLIMGGIITGILIIIAYVKIKDSTSRRRMPPAAGQQQY